MMSEEYKLEKDIQYNFKHVQNGRYKNSSCNLINNNAEFIIRSNNETLLQTAFPCNSSYILYKKLNSYISHIEKIINSRLKKS